MFAEFWKAHFKFGSTMPNQLLSNSNELSSTLLSSSEKVDMLFSSTVSNQLNKNLPENFIDVFFSVSFSHHYIIASKTKKIDEAWFYISKVASEFWNFRHLESQLKNKHFQKKGMLPNNFNNTLPAKHFEKALKTFKDEYLLDFINIEDGDEENERVLEHKIVLNIKKFILSIGNDFAFMGNQYRMIVVEQEYFIDLLFYNRKLQCLVAIELKTGKFKPEYLGKMNFYLSALDDLIKQPHENSSIGIILCKEKNNKIVEYSFRDFNKAMGVATYKTSEKLPNAFKNALPDAETLKKLLD
ncbi:MAG: DUF1016 domain-containing protein [Flavobacteriaceae bacterium]|nr:DUF1016 domain-containing protein [Flavobacteriaceae bacterium]